MNNGTFEKITKEEKIHWKIGCFNPKMQQKKYSIVNGE